MRPQALIVGFMLIAGTVAVTARLAQVMFFGDSRIEKFSARQRAGSVNIHLPRGVIYDRNMNEMAVSVDMRSVYVNPRKIKDPAKVSVALASLLKPANRTDIRKLAKRIERSIKSRKRKSFIWVERKVSEATYRKIRKANLTGVGFVKEAKRFYPKRDIAAKIIGFCGIDNQGLYGLEYYYDKEIGPKTSRFNVVKDALGRPISMPDAVAIFEKSAPYDLALTIDERIQYITEKALERQVKRFHAKGGVAVVMNPVTGDILAIAEQPKYNPNNYAKYTAEWWKSKAVSNAIEPGSTFKLFVAASALEANLASPDETIDCENGRYKIAGRYFKEAQNHKYNLLTVSEIIEKSSNIGTIKIAERLGAERLISGLKLFGFGSKTGIDLPGESAGLLRGTSDWSSWSLPSISFGQEVAITPVQLVTALSAFANGGYIIRPRIVKAYYRNGKLEKTLPSKIIRRAISKKTALAITEMMVGVVKHGTGKRAAVPGFTVAGKTGTAQKADPGGGGYSKDKFIASFAGFFPAEKPRLAIVVIVDEPEKTIWGGSVAAPAFSEIAIRSARILRIPGTETEVYEIDWKKMMDGNVAETETQERSDFSAKARINSSEQDGA